MRRATTSITQRAIHRPYINKPVQSPDRRPELALSRMLPISFDVRLYDGTQCVKKLYAGKTYTLVITGSPNSSSLHRSGIRIQKPITLYLHCATDDNATQQFALEDIKFELSYKEAVNFKEKRILKIGDKFPHTHLLVGLSYTEAGDELVEHLGEHKIPIEGTYTPVDRKLLTDCHIDAGLPEHVVILLAERNSPGPTRTFKLRGWSHWGEQLYEEAAEPETLVSVADLQRHQLDFEEVIARLRKFSGTISYDLTHWLQTLHAKYGEQLCVIIIDHTRLEIPWEMLELDDYQHLGALARVVRWLPFRRYTHFRRLTVSDVVHKGSVITYLDSGLGAEGTAPEREILQKLAIESCETLEVLEQRIRRQLKAGLIYVGCHGETGQQLFAGGKRQRTSTRLLAIKLEFLHKSSDPHTIVFVNACESARIIKNNELDPGSFVEGFLARCACGYIGTLAKIDILTASLIGKEILTAALDPDGVQIAEILRRLRAEIAPSLKKALQLPDNDMNKRKQLQKVIDTFMYVYYGNPLARLRLLAADHEEEV